METEHNLPAQGEALDITQIKPLALQVLQTLEDYCRSKGLRQSLFFGSLLGAVRHGGFIPWDDDIDIVLLRREYDYLVTHFNHDCPQAPVRIVSMESDKDYPYPYAKAIHTHTVLVEQSKSPLPLGVFVDIFPADRMPQTAVKAYERKVWMLQKIVAAKNILPSTVASAKKRLAVRLVDVLTCWRSKRAWLEAYDATCRAHNDCPTGGLKVYTSQQPTHAILTEEMFNHLQQHPFEGGECCIFSCYDLLLRQLFGHYMQWPPVEQQVSNHNFTAHMLQAEATPGLEAPQQCPTKN